MKIIHWAEELHMQNCQGEKKEKVTVNVDKGFIKNQKMWLLPRNEIPVVLNLTRTTEPYSSEIVSKSS